MPRLLTYCAVTAILTCLYHQARALPYSGYCKIPDTPEYTMWQRGVEGRSAYEKALVKLLLQKTALTYGPFVLRAVKRQLNFERERIESLNAQNYHIHVAPNTPPPKRLDDKFVRLKQPIAQGLFGYRRLVVRRDDLDKFSRIYSVKQLQGLNAGMGLGWPEAQVLRNNGFSVVESINTHSLFAMLEKYRFDYIPLAANEAQATLTTMQKEFPNMVLEPNIVLYYPFAQYLHVRKADTELVNRLSHSLQQAKLDGSFHQLFNQHFGTTIGALQQPNIRIFNLKNQQISVDGVHPTPVLITLPASARPNQAFN